MRAVRRQKRSPRSAACATRMEASHADAIVALGGMGSDERELEATLGVLARPGGQAGVAGDRAARRSRVGRRRGRGDRGAASARRDRDRRPARPLDRCRRQPRSRRYRCGRAGRSRRTAANGRLRTSTRIYAELADKPGLRVALVAGAPREEQHGGEVSGELALVPVPAIDVVVHGPTRPEPSPQRSGGRDGARVACSPGTSDATPRLPETRPPAAGVLAIRGAAWTWSPLVDR